MVEIVIPILRIASILCTCNGNNTWYLCDLQENKDALYTAMEELKDTRDDVKRKIVEAEKNPNESMKCNKEVSGWLECVQAIEGDVVQVLLKADKEIKGSCFGGYCSINCWSRYKIGKLVTQTLAIVKDSRIKGSFDNVAHKLPPSLVEKEAAELTVGMESMFDKVWRLLAEDEVRIMGLYGCGGVGKTTLLKQINNEFLKSTTTTTSSSSNTHTHGFDVVILVVVSKVIKIKDIQKEIGDRLGLSSPNEKSIRHALSKKSFLLLLDDIWERVDLQSMGVPSPSENSKSKLIFTTRSETVCGLMEANEMFKVECLPWNEAWSLFQKKVGERALNSFPRAHELAKDVARECGGLPLVLITIGRAMSSKKIVQEWNHAITTLQKSASELPGMGDEVLPLLKLSYDNLRGDTIKSCFLYCALFPEDHLIYIPKLVDYWIGEGFISLSDFNHIDEARNYGYDVIGDLKGACLLESGGDAETEVKMHDMIRDMALWITRECGSSKRDKMLNVVAFDCTSERLWYNAERIYLMSFGDEIPTLKSPNLLTLIHQWRGDVFLLPQTFFEYMPRLRILDLTNNGMDILPTSITELLELQYLNLRGIYIKELPQELGKLVKLKFLDLSHMMFLEKIPSGMIGSLVELRVLNLYDCSGAVGWDIEEVYNLKHMNPLGITINIQHSNLTKLLSSNNKNLQKCTRHLLVNNYPPQLYTSSSAIITLEKLQLLFNLETLRLVGIPEVNMGIEQQQQHHLGSSSCFQNLSDICITYCNSLKDLTWVGYMAGNLKALRVDGCEELEEIVIVVVDDFGGSTGGGGSSNSSSKKMTNNVKDKIFKSLRTLEFMCLPKLKSICRNALAFPCLESMVVLRCPQLKKLPLDSASNINNTLQKIRGEPKWWSELQWEDNNNNDGQLKSKFLPYFITIGKKQQQRAVQV